MIERVQTVSDNVIEQLPNGWRKITTPSTRVLTRVQVSTKWFRNLLYKHAAYPMFMTFTASAFVKGADVDLKITDGPNCHLAADDGEFLMYNTQVTTA